MIRFLPGYDFVIGGIRSLSPNTTRAILGLCGWLLYDQDARCLRSL